MNSFKAKLVTSVLGYGLIIGAAVGAIIYYKFPTYFSNWYFGILGFFLVIESLVLLYVEYDSRKENGKQLVNSYMLTKVFKIIAILGFVIIYYVSEGKEEIRNFVIPLMVLYALFLLVETFFFSKIEKRLKEKK